jgi:hypothetical protein
MTERKCINYFCGLNIKLLVSKEREIGTVTAVGEEVKCSVGGNFQ